MARFDLVILDCDGTLVDSEGSIVRVMNIAMAQMGLADQVTDAQVASVVGLSLLEATRELLPGRDDALCLQVIACYKDHYKRMADAGELGDRLFPGVRETLERLRAAGLILAMATGKSMRGVERTLREQDLGGFFTVIKTADCAPSKPHPGMVEQILAETAQDQTRTLMVGDTDFDLLMGRNAGVRSCAVTYGCHPRARLAAAQPDYWINTLSELPAIIGL